MRAFTTGLVLIAATAIMAPGLRATPQGPPQDPPGRERRVATKPNVVISGRNDVSRRVRDVVPHVPRPEDTEQLQRCADLLQQP